MNLYKPLALMVPVSIVKVIIEKEHIDKATNTQDLNTPMEYLFDVYEEFIDLRGEFENWYCYKCRQAILDNWRHMKPTLEEIYKNSENGSI